MECTNTQNLGNSNFIFKMKEKSQSFECDLIFFFFDIIKCKTFFLVKSLTSKTFRFTLKEEEEENYTPNNTYTQSRQKMHTGETYKIVSFNCNETLARRLVYKTV